MVDKEFRGFLIIDEGNFSDHAKDLIVIHWIIMCTK